MNNLLEYRQQKSLNRHTTAFLGPHYAFNLNTHPFFLEDLRQSKCRLCSDRLAPSRDIDCSKVLTFFCIDLNRKDRRFFDES